MNSALQCLTHVPELVNYFLSGYFKREINRTNPIGYNGKIAEAFGDLLEHLFGEERSLFHMHADLLKQSSVDSILHLQVINNKTPKNFCPICLMAFMKI